MASITGLHLQYRLWIAEMNANINVLRIFDDYLEEIKAKDNGLKNVDGYKQHFSDLRKEMDELRHEMYLNKMKLAALAKAGNALAGTIESDINHTGLEKQYKTFKSKFIDLQKDFEKFVSNN